MREVVWTDDAAQLLRQYLESPSGRALLDTLRLSRPAWPAQWNDPHQAALTAARIAGWEACVDMVVWLSYPEETRRKVLAAWTGSPTQEEEDLT